jgi:hypothetical protein
MVCKGAHMAWDSVSECGLSILGCVDHEEVGATIVAGGHAKAIRVHTEGIFVQMLETRSSCAFAPLQQRLLEGGNDRTGETSRAH